MSQYDDIAKTDEDNMNLMVSDKLMKDGYIICGVKEKVSGKRTPFNLVARKDGEIRFIRVNASETKKDKNPSDKIPKDVIKIAELWLDNSGYRDIVESTHYDTYIANIKDNTIDQRLDTFTL